MERRRGASPTNSAPGSRDGGRARAGRVAGADIGWCEQSRSAAGGSNTIAAQLPQVQ